MKGIEKLLPSVKPVVEEIGRKSSVRRDTTMRVVEFHIKLQSWVEEVVKTI